MIRRLVDYRKSNESVIAEPSVSTFFAENAVTVFIESCEIPQDKAIDSFKIYIERVEKPFNYMTVDKDNEAKRLKEI